MRLHVYVLCSCKAFGFHAPQSLPIASYSHWLYFLFPKLHMAKLGARVHVMGFSAPDDVADVADVGGTFTGLRTYFNQTPIIFYALALAVCLCGVAVVARRCSRAPTAPPIYYNIAHSFTSHLAFCGTLGALTMTMRTRRNGKSM